MFCQTCGKEIADSAAFCSYCGAKSQTSTVPAASNNTDSAPGALLYQLAPTQKRCYTLRVYSDLVTIQGSFWYLRDKEFFRSKTQSDSAPISHFLGIGYLSKRSYRKCVLFVVAGLILETAKLLFDWVTAQIDKANNVLRWVDRSIALPEWVGITMNVLVVVCLLLGLVLFFSKKNVVEISFTDKRICVPKGSMSAAEYQTLYQTIRQAKKARS